MSMVANLCRSMRVNRMGRVHFRFIFDHSEIDTLILVDETPLRLILYRPGIGVVVGEIRCGFCINPFLGHDDPVLRRILGIQSRGDEKWKPTNFFIKFDYTFVPKNASLDHHDCLPEHSAPRYQNHFNDSEKVYFAESSTGNGSGLQANTSTCRQSKTTKKLQRY